jgi:hypothetical protein
MFFEIVGNISDVEIIAIGRASVRVGDYERLTPAADGGR